MSFKKCRDLILGVVTLLLGGFYMYFATQIKTRPKLTPSYSSSQVIPRLLGILLIILSVLLIIQGIRKLKLPEAASSKMDRGDLVSVVLTIVCILGYVLLMQPLGFCLATVIYLFCQMIVLAPRDKRNYVLFAVVAVAFTAVVFVAFRLGLNQLLPRGVIEGLVGL